MKAVDFIEKFENLSKLRQQMVIAEMVGMLNALGKIELLENLIKEYENM